MEAKWFLSPVIILMPAIKNILFPSCFSFWSYQNGVMLLVSLSL
jgi:hypothetical protein